jgi:hypothetical protein
MASKMKPSAYRSLQLGKEGKTNSTQAEKEDLKRWVKEDWRNLTPLTLGDTKFYTCGRKSQQQIKEGLPSICRPSIKVNSNTPDIASKYSMAQLKKAVQIKKEGKRIDWNKL